MSVSKYLFIVSMNVKTEYENLFNEVYDDEHVPYLLEVPGVNKVTRGKGEPFQFSIAGETKDMDAPQQKFVALYEIDSPEVCLLYTSPSPRDGLLSRMPSSA